MSEQEDRAWCAANGIHYCEPGNPFPGGTGRAMHPQAGEVGEQEDGYPGGDIVTYLCPVCQTRWKAELPQ